MAYTKPLVTTTVYFHDGENPVVFADAITNGKTVRYGSTAKQQILNGEAVDSIGSINGGDAASIIIPFHAVIRATYATADSDEITPATDDFCE